MSREYDVIVVGLGAMGSATLYHLASRGRKVLGIDRFDSPHDQGSSHGLTRIIREAYYEGPLYVPLVRRAFELWSTLATESGQPHLLQRNGGIFVGPPNGELVDGALTSARAHDVPHELLDADQLRRRFPKFTFRDEWVALFEPGAGFLRPEASIAAHLELARAKGATIVGGEPVHRCEPGTAAVSVTTARATFEAGQVVLSPGAWMSGMAPNLAPLFRVERQTTHWFASMRGAHFGPSEMPIAMWELEDGRIFYTTPDVGRGVKGAFHHGGEIVDAETANRRASADECEEARQALATLVPDAAGPPCGSAVCLYTDTPDERFIIDWLPDHRNVLMVSACSGHGFKFSAAIGEIAADLLDGQRPAVDIAPFSLDRFA